MRVPLIAFRELDSPLTLDELREREAEIMEIREALTLRFGAPLYFPWVPYRGGPMRTAQTYLARLPRATLALFPRLEEAALHVALPEVFEDGDLARSVRAVVAMAGKARLAGGQGYRNDAAANVAIEALAMSRAIEYFSELGCVSDVHGTESFDLVCEVDGQELHVEVKGSTTSTETVFLTANEVSHSQTYPHVALFVLADIDLTRESGGIEATGGRTLVFNPWQLDASKLSAVSYRYSIPRQTAED